MKTLVNNALPSDAFPDEQYLPCRDARHYLRYPAQVNVTQELLDRNLELGRANRPVIRYRGVTWTYGALAERVNRLANALANNGLQPGHRILLHLPNIPAFVESWLASLRIGGVVVATVPMLKQREIQPIVEETEPACLITVPELYPVVAECFSSPILRVVVGEDTMGAISYEDFIQSGSRERDAAPTHVDDIAIIAYTSGSTGRPKGTIHTHGDLLAIADTYAKEILTPAPEDCFAGHPSMAFTYGLGALLVFPMRFGASVVLNPAKFNPVQWLDIIQREEVTLFFATPTACRLYLQESACWARSTWRSVRTVVTAGEKLPPATFTTWREATGVEILDGCGSTEMLHIWISQRLGEAVGGCTGRPVTLYEARLLNDVGEEIRDREAEGILALRGPTGCRYWKQPQLQKETVRNGWTLSGDYFRRDAEGRYWHISRTDDIIVSGGYNIAPVEVEEVLLKHPAVLEAAVVGIPDDVRGQIVRAYVVMKSPGVTDDSYAKEIQQFVKYEIAAFKCPREIHFVDTLPRTATGKIDRQSLRAVV